MKKMRILRILCAEANAEGTVSDILFTAVECGLVSAKKAGLIARENDMAYLTFADNDELVERNE